MTDTQERSYDGCPHLGWRHLWNSGVKYAAMSEEHPPWGIMSTVDDAVTGEPVSLYVDADAMSLYHFFTFWGYVDGRL